jgi:hypothetical protein
MGICDQGLSLLRRLREKITTIPNHNPPAGLLHPLAIFSGDPTAYSDERGLQRDWTEYLQPMMRKAFGQGEFDLENSREYVHGGPNGLDGFCDFLDHFVVIRGLRGALIQPYVEFLLKAVEKR